MNCIYDLLDNLVSKQDQRRIETSLRPIIVGIEVAERPAVAATVLIVALVRHDEREVRDRTRSKIAPQTARAVEGSGLRIAQERVRPLLDIFKIDKGIVLCGI